MINSHQRILPDVSYYVYTFLIYILLVGCKQKPDLAEFHQQFQLSGQPVEEITMFSQGNVGLCVADTFLVIQKGEEPFFQIYSTNTHEQLAEFGIEGKGPGEFMSAELKKQIEYDSGNNSPVVKVFDFRRQTVSSINILNAIKEEGKTKTERLPVGNFAVYFFYKGEDFYLAAPNREGRFFIHNYQTSRDTVIPYVPKLEFSIPQQTLPVVYRSTASVNLERGLIASAPFLFGELDFFDLEGNYLRSTVFEPTEELKEGLATDNPIYQIAELDAKGDLIYGLNYNNRVEDFYEPDRENNVKVQVFDWNGSPVKEYYLDDRLITSFAVDPIHNRIYAYSPDEMNHTIISYPIE